MSSSSAQNGLPPVQAKPFSFPAWLLRLLPFLRWAGRVNRGTLKADLLAGLTGAVVVLPQGVAFATIAGMPPEYGLYAGIVPAIVAALWGSSWHLVSGPTTAASIVVFSGLSVMAEPGSPDYIRLALTLTLMVGVLELTMGLARLGSLVNFISHSVVVGFTAGAAFLIAANQFKNFFGIEIPRGLHFHEMLGTLLLNVEHVNLLVTGVGVATLVIGLAFRHWYPRVPYMIVAMVGGSLIAFALNQLLGLDHTGIRTVGALPGGCHPCPCPTSPWIPSANSPRWSWRRPYSPSPRRSPSPARSAPGPTSTSTAIRSSSARGYLTSPAPSSPAMSPPAPSTAADSTSRPGPRRPWRRSPPASSWPGWWSWSPRWRPIFPMRPWRPSCSSWPGG
jgi:hypothetical protein